ncbi:endonuclease/exonuclease/phosphatase protein [Haloferula helveola]|uniref:Endonuclease/exonuclease/phosphatase protein n=1 Tax=Haloferula helveola TaxID=490095 RepID=A0ABM7RH79_9BACT|nr:endonuclease/exonuclease/phosphatase protein [Haloferula helveola]
MLRRLPFLILLTTALHAVELRVATFNIETHRNASGWPDYALDEPGTVDFDSVAAILQRIDADVVALQEVHTSDINEGDVDALGAVLGLTHIHPGSNTGNFDSSLRVVILSRYPFISTDSVLSPSGAKEIARHCPAVLVDVPGTTADPLVISTHLKSGTASSDRFRRSIEMRRLAEYLAGFSLAPGGNFIVLGDFNPSGNNTTFNSLPSGLPTTYSLGSDVSLPVSYSTDMVSYFTTPVPTRLDPRQLDGDDATFQSGSTLDLFLVSPGLAGRPFGTEIYNSILDVSNSEGLPKTGSPLAASTSSDASDHYALFADFELDQEAFDLGLAISTPTISESDSGSAAILTVTLAEPAVVPVTVTFVSNDSAAEPVLPSVEIPVGGTGASTPVSTSRNFLIDGTRTVTFTASASGYASADVVAQLLDADSGYAFAQAGETLLEDFDGFGGDHDPAPWVTDAPSWQGVDDGGSATPGGRAYGSAGENAPGVLSEGASVVMETTVTNGASEPLTILDLSYDAEQWRSAPGGAEDSIEVELILGGVAYPVPELGFVARTDLPEGAVAGGNPETKSVRIEGLSVPAGGTFGLRFRHVPGEGSAPLPEDVFINEFHYDNDSTDQGEFVEVVVGPGFVGDLATVELQLYNGSNGLADGAAHGLDTFLLGDTTPSGHRVFSKEIAGIQNGSPDGMALVIGGTVAEFISYEGAFTAANGPASGLDSVDVGVSQPSNNPVDERAIGRTGTGTSPGDFEWVRFDAGVFHSPGSLNDGQTIVSPGVPSQGLAVDNVSLTFVEDSDGDGIADDFDPDDDNDGSPDEEELAFGTDPLDPGSKFSVEVGNGPGGPELLFPGAEGVVYTIEWCDDLTSWDQSATVEGTGGPISFPLPSGDPRLFARVRAGE